MPAPTVTIAVGHNLEHLNLPINMFDRNPFPRQPTIIRLLFRRQRLVLTLLERQLTVLMIGGNALVTAVRLESRPTALPVLDLYRVKS